MGKRITFRIENGDYERLSGRSRDTGLDCSYLIRRAIAEYLEGEPRARDTKSEHVAPRAVLPAEAFALTPPFRGWPGDLRAELKKRYMEMLALASITVAHWPRTKGIREVYDGLLELAHYLDIKDGV